MKIQTCDYVHLVLYSMNTLYKRYCLTISNVLWAVFCLLFTASALRCYDCKPGNNSAAGSAIICSKPVQTVECSSDFDSCSILKVTSDELDMYYLDCFLKSFCSEAQKNLCEVSTQGLHDASCDMSCCETDLCNKPKESSTSGTLSRVPASAAIFVILSVIAMVLVDMIWNILLNISSKKRITKTTC